MKVAHHGVRVPPDKQFHSVSGNLDNQLSGMAPPARKNRALMPRGSMTVCGEHAAAAKRSCFATSVAKIAKRQLSCFEPGVVVAPSVVVQAPGRGLVADGLGCSSLPLECDSMWFLCHHGAQNQFCLCHCGKRVGSESERKI